MNRKLRAVAGFRRLLAEERHGLGPVLFALLSVALGAVAGLGAFAFRSLIGLFHNVFFFGAFTFEYDPLRHSLPSPLGAAWVLIPPAGAVIVVFLVKNFAPEAKGHGVPEVMDAIYYQKAAIRPVVALIKSLASATSIGSGGSVGREGPIIQIGAAAGSWAGRLCGVSRWQLATLVAAGGGAGIAATFNTPIGGVLFAAEILMHEISVRTLVPVALATATATYVGHHFFGDHPAFPIPPITASAVGSAGMLAAFVVLGGLTALGSVAFIRGLYGTEDLFEKLVPGRDYLRHVLGMLGVGLIAVALLRTTGTYQVEGVGYATIMDVLTGSLLSVVLLLMLFVLKLAATSLTLGSGASGGIFSPSLFMGTTLGAAYGIVLAKLFPGWHVDPTPLAVAGMAGMVAGATGAALTAIVMIFEMTLNYSVVLPMTLTVAVSYGLRRLLLSESIYTMKLARRGHYMPKALQANATLVHHVSDVQLDAVTVLPADAPVASVAGTAPPDAATTHLVLLQQGRVVGLLSRDRLTAYAHGAVGGPATLGDAAAQVGEKYVSVPSGTTIFALLARMQATHAPSAVVLAPADHLPDAPTILGVITMAHLAEILAEGMEMFGE